MHEELRQLHQQAGKPSLVVLEKHARLEGHAVSKSAFGDLLNGRGRPRLETVDAFVAACVRHARERRPRLQLPPEALDPAVWRARYAAAFPTAETPTKTASTDGAFVSARQKYVERLRERYGRVDLEILTPLTEQDEHPPVELREVFIAQQVRADPPPVELPKELWRRLAEAGELHGVICRRGWTRSC